MEENKHEVYISYAWGGESEKIVNDLEASLQVWGFSTLRDKKDLDFKGSITGFMEKIGRGKAVVVVISDKYLKSPYCMFELMEIYRNRDFLERIFPIVLEDARIFDPVASLSYLQYWEQKNTELKTAIQQFGLDAINLISDEYKVYHKILNNFGEVVNLLRDINVLTPELHQASDFEHLREAILQRFDRDVRNLRQQDSQKLLQQLFTGSQAYYKELTGLNGPYHFLNISEAILAGVRRIDSADGIIKTPLNINVKSKLDGEPALEFPLRDLLHQEKTHMILLGHGGMGKSVSVIHLWEILLENRNVYGAVPLFLSLQEYNMVSESERSDFIAKRIAWHYLGLKDDRGEAVKLLWEAFKISPENGASIVLFLDGFNEITVESKVRGKLLLELQELRQKGNIVQIIITSRYEMNFSWAEGFKTLELQLLGENQVKDYLQGLTVTYPEDIRLGRLLQNPMMLTLYANVSEIIQRYKKNKFFEFKTETTSQGELIWNFLEAQLVKLEKIYGSDASDFFYYKFMIRHMLPYVGYQMEKQMKFSFDQNEMANIIDEACHYFYQEEFILVHPEYRSQLRYFNLEELEFPKNGERFDKIVKILCRDLCLLRYTANSYEFFHQNFRDFFAAAHLCNSAAKSISSRKIPAEWQNQTLHGNLLQIVADVEGEHYPAPIRVSSNGSRQLSEHKNNISGILDLCRGVFDEKIIGFTIWNIVKVIEKGRGTLAGLDLRKLNLAKIAFNGLLLTGHSGKSFDPALFHGSLLHGKQFLPNVHQNRIRSICYSPDGTKILSASEDKTIKEILVNTGECVNTFVGHTDYVNHACYSRDGSKVLSASKDGTVKEWLVLTNQIVFDLELKDRGNRISVDFAYYSSNENEVLITTYNCIVEWSLVTGENIHTYTDDQFSCARYSPNSDKIVAAGLASGKLYQWKSLTGECLQVFSTISRWRPQTAQYDPQAMKVLASLDNEVIEILAETGERVNTFTGHEKYIKYACYSPDGTRVLSASADGTLKEWSVETGSCLGTFRIGKAAALHAAYNPDGSKILSYSDDNIVREWAVDTFECLQFYRNFDTGVNTASYNNAENKIIAACEDGTAREWAVDRGICLQTFLGHTAKVTCAVYSHDDKKILTASSDGTIREWLVQTGECVMILSGHKDVVTSASYSADGTKILSSSYDCTAKEWSVTTGECLRTYDCLCSLGVAYYSKDGKKIVASTDDQNERIEEFSIETGDCINVVNESYTSKSAVLHDTTQFTYLMWMKRPMVMTRDDGFVRWPDEDGEIKEIQKQLSMQSAKKFPYEVGFYFHGCDLSHLHPSSQFTDEEKERMRYYGAIFNDSDKHKCRASIEEAYA